MRGSVLLAALLGATAIGGAAQALQPPPAVQQATIDPRSIVTEVRRIIAERYVLPERRPALDALLARGLETGRYDTRDPAVLAERINADLATANDGHLNFGYNPRQAQMLGTPRSDDGPPPEAFVRLARAANHGVSELRVLPGNIRYMRYDGFIWTGPESAAALDNAMRFLAGGDAIVIDIRHNGGGSPQAVQYLVSHFLPPNRPLVEFHMGGRTEPDRLSTLAELPAGRLTGRPFYLLTSRHSASAAEEFSGHVAGFQLGELVGDRTAGAAFRNDLVPIADAFVLSVSVGRPVLAATGGDWERTGIAPTMPAPVESALEAAQVHALRRLASAAQGQDRERLEAVAETADARLTPRQPGQDLATYVGTYGERTVRTDGDRLLYQLGERPPVALIPLGGNRFGFEHDAMLRIDFQVAEGRAVSFDLGPAGGPLQGRYERSR